MLLRFMAIYQYRALQANGGVAEGQLEAAGRSEAFRQMEGLGLKPISLAETKNGTLAKGPVAALNGSTDIFASFKRTP
ncbi:MAG TPA: hypothetical protein VHI52_07080, partial [Verrucomicrobiae bacterium]|nr:hypothetical protein [Verrucomicrobiae bacterium]